MALADLAIIPSVLTVPAVMPRIDDPDPLRAATTVLILLFCSPVIFFVTTGPVL